MYQRELDWIGLILNCKGTRKPGPCKVGGKFRPAKTSDLQRDAKVHTPHGDGEVTEFHGQSASVWHPASKQNHTIHISDIRIRNQS